ncbi:MAG: hypothetical protein K8R02_01785 [Anaerohalosphaeraceae bacterium]|nr:hypothetical protein [Anaerohalosphaeraceae bacterium]
MYHKDDTYQQKFEDFYLPFGGKPRSDNCWVISMAADRTAMRCCYEVICQWL